MKTPHLDELERLRGLVEAYEEKHELELNKEIDSSYRAMVKRKLPRILKAGNFVWCRNGSVCSNATPCSQLECPYKKSKDDIVNGCSKCRDFTVCDRESNWNSARQVFNSQLEVWSID